MSEDRYYVTIDNKTVADNCTIEIATILVKAIFDTYYKEADMVVAVAKCDTNV